MTKISVYTITNMYFSIIQVDACYSEIFPIKRVGGSGLTLRADIIFLSRHFSAIFFSNMHLIFSSKIVAETQ
jgi:hypothetical protein